VNVERTDEKLVKNSISLSTFPGQLRGVSFLLQASHGESILSSSSNHSTFSSEPRLPLNYGIDKRHHIDRIMLNEEHSMLLFYNG
jgi:hypothetical protein